MQPSGWIQFAIFFIALALITKPMGLYLLRVLDVNGKTWLDPVLSPLERLTYRVMISKSFWPKFLLVKNRNHRLALTK
jgi:K+-transporting ATPase ATPase A chain